MKVCKRCSKEHNIQNFRKSKKHNSGYENICKDCRKLEEAEYRANNKDLIKENRDRFNENNRERLKQYNKEYQNTEKCKKYQKEYRELNREKIANQTKEWREINKEKIKDKRQTSEYKTKRKKWREAGKEKSQEYSKEYNSRPEVIEKRRLYDKERNKKPNRKLKRRYYSSQRKRRVKEATPKWLGKLDKKELKRFYDEAYELIQNTGEDHHVDHIVPLKGELVCGLNVPWNLQVLKWDDNLKKSNKFDGTYENEGWKYE